MPEHRTSLRVYRALLRVYPAAFRDRYGEEMVQLLGDQLTDARTRAGGTGVARTWLQVLGDLAVTATSERMWRDRTVANSLAAPLMTTQNSPGSIALRRTLSAAVATVVTRLTDFVRAYAAACVPPACAVIVSSTPPDSTAFSLLVSAVS